MQADSLREKFLDFFKSRGHKIVNSDSLVPHDDPTVLFTPAGMNQFKKEFLGFDSGFKRAATSQRCLRTDDLDKVGKTSAHHTLFEMLGNFSFGDYFKKEAIAWAWEFLTKELKINREKLWVSVYKDDDEAYNIWLNDIKIPAKKIVKFGDKDNFWPAEAKTKGPNGPCGPCSEIFFDFGEKVGCGESVCGPSCSCGRFVEIWNLVFTQFNRQEDGALVPLPNKNIDTGMGLERLTAVMEDKPNNFETELFQPIIKGITRGQSPSETVPTNEPFYAIADHARAIVFSIYDGIFPSNEGRGYVVRKIIRKSILHLRALGINKPFIFTLVPLVAQVMRKPYPDLKDKQEDIAQVVLNEEKRFINVLNDAPGIYKIVFSAYDSTGLKNEAAMIEISKKVFELYDTHGIPLELTKSWLNSNGLKYDEDVIHSEFKAQKDRSRASSSMKGDVFDVKGLSLSLKETEFTGYEDYSGEAKVLSILNDGKEVDRVSAGDSAQVVLDQSYFYAESGGQVGDTGELTSGKVSFEVLDTKKTGNIFLHIGKINSGVLKIGDKVTAKINIERRLRIARNHTATHILQAALRKVLGSHVQQQGSLVSEEKLRFDFTHFKGLTKDEIARVENEANNYVAGNHLVSINEMTLKEAKETKALAFFGEKYGEKVRIVSVGDISKEFCGGAHVHNTSEIGLIKIAQEGSVASGIRRIEAVTGEFAKQFIKEQEQMIIAEIDKKKELGRTKELEKEQKITRNLSLQKLAPQLIEKGIKINGINTIISLEESMSIDDLRLLADKIKEKSGETIICLGSEDKAAKRAFLIIALTPALLLKGLDAKALIRQIAPIIGGSGGGRNDFAQAGGSEPGNFTLAFDKLRDIIKS
ncbi:MAG: alanine--tRNA ligase [Candidatus Omnitrophota bacterium]|jgi:alanyl-tRNA synthetase